MRCSICSWCDRLSGRYLIELVPAIAHYWCNKGCCMYYLVCGMVHIKEPLLLIYHMSDAIQP